MLSRHANLRILFDKNVPAPLRRFLGVHSVELSANRGWGELKNGVLLKIAEGDGFDVLVTANQNIKYQQNLHQRRIALVVLSSNRWPYLQMHLPEIVASVNVAEAGSFRFVSGFVAGKVEIGS